MHVRGGWWALGIAAAAQAPGVAAMIAAARSSLVTTVQCTTATIAAGL
jgi:hypothetical protein